MPIHITYRDLCESLERLYIDSFHAVSVESRLTGPSAVDEPIRRNASCEVFNSAEEVSYGRIGLRYVPDDPNPIGVLKPMYIETNVDGETVWVFNQLVGPVEYAQPGVFLAATIDGWFGNMLIEPRKTWTANGTVEFTEVEQKSASDFLVDVLRRTVAAQPK